MKTFSDSELFPPDSRVFGFKGEPKKTKTISSAQRMLSALGTRLETKMVLLERMLIFPRTQSVGRQLERVVFKKYCFTHTWALMGSLRMIQSA